MKTKSTSEEIPLRATDISEFIRRNSCERRFKLGLNNRALTRELPYFNRFLNTIDPVLQREGHRRENDWAESLTRQGLINKTRQISRISKKGKQKLNIGTLWQQVVEDVASADIGQSFFWREVQLQETIEAFNIKGNLDFLLLTWSQANTPVLHVVECKSSRRDKTYHRAQVVTYQLLLEKIASHTPLIWQGIQLSPIDFLYRVARIDETNNQNQDILSLPALDLSLERTDIELLLSHGGALETIKNAPLNALPYQLNEKCDGCTFSPHCFPESARYRRLELLGIAPSVCRVLRLHGIDSIDALAQIDVSSVIASSIRNSLGFNSDLVRLRAEASARLSTLPRGANDPDNFPVTRLNNSGSSQLPTHSIAGSPLVRVYLCVEYDYVENRIGALSAHITSSPNKIQTPFEFGRSGRPLPSIVEMVPSGTADENGEEVLRQGPLRGEDIRQIVSSAWSGIYATDSGTEKQLIQSFFSELVEAIASVASPQREAPIHFYVWSRQEMKLLIEACTRVDSRLLSHLRELLGSRQQLEQLIYSSLRDEVNQRYGLGWTGRGLGVVSSLMWFGKRYHWARTINQEPVELDFAFAQDIFDFKTDLEYDPMSAGYWLDKKTSGDKHKFEIRSRFNDGLPAPYWRAFWGDLPESPDMDKRTLRATQYYNQASNPRFLREYLSARTHALRWLDERESFKNDQIQKIPLVVRHLANFSLGIASAAQAGVDFLRLDHHVKVNDWLIDGLQPTSARVNSGRTLPLRSIEALADNKRLRAYIDPSPFHLTLESLQVRTRYEVGSFVRLSPCENNPERGQTIGQLLYGGSTCVVVSIDWESGEVILEPRFARSGTSPYSLYSKEAARYQNESPLFATLDESVTDFVAQKVEDRLRGQRGSYVFQWFDPETPATPPLQTTAVDAVEQFIPVFRDARGNQLQPDQAAAVLAGMRTRIHLLQGPPGTGKTTTTATAILGRIAARYQAGNVLLVSAHTHTAVDTLLARIAANEQGFREQASRLGITMPAIHLIKAHSSRQGAESVDGVDDWFTFRQAFQQQTATGVLVIGGTTNALLKMADDNTTGLSGGARFRNLPQGFQVDELIVDEASMMVFPHFLALATLVQETGSIMLTGDHRQLPPIVSHDWENEDRPPTVFYQPFLSAYDAIRRLLQYPVIVADTTRMHYSALTFSFRLPPIIRDLIKKLYHLDELVLTGRNLPEYHRTDSSGQHEGWSSVWANNTGLYLVLHKERLSGQSNEIEAEIINHLLVAGSSQPASSIAVIAPHRAQRTLLKTRLEHFHHSPYETLDLVDTVNRLQGAERPTIIVSAAMSDPSDIAANAEFILELNRANVAFSRAQQRLIVVCSESLLNHIPVEAERYQETLLWKSLRQLCTVRVANETVTGIDVQILTPPFDPPLAVQ